MAIAKTEGRLVASREASVAWLGREVRCAGVDSLHRSRLLAMAILFEVLGSVWHVCKPVQDGFGVDHLHGC